MTESMGSQWAYRLATLVAVYELKGAPRICKNIDLSVSSIKYDLLLSKS